MTTSRSLAPIVLEGEILQNAHLEPWEIGQMNIAREEYKKLKSILLNEILPGIGGYENPVASDIARHLEQIGTFSGNFCWRYRLLGQMHNATCIGSQQ